MSFIGALNLNFFYIKGQVKRDGLTYYLNTDQAKKVQAYCYFPFGFVIERL